MSDHERRRSLDEIITENAVLYLRRRVAARRMERKSYYLSNLAEEMSPHMPPEDRSESHEKELARVARTVSRYLGLSKTAKVAWRLDYFDAFCRALGVDPGDMLTPPPPLDAKEEQWIRELTGGLDWISLSPEEKGRKPS